MRIWAGVLAVALLGACGSGDDAADEPDTPAAGEVCQELVLERLKSPATAEFVDDPSVEQHERYDNQWVVVGEVDSQNGFGAQVRSIYQCDMHQNDDGSFKMLTGKEPVIATR